MSEDHVLSASRETREIRPGKRDFGFILIGLAIGIGLGSSFSKGDHHVFLIVLTISLASYGSRLIYSARSDTH
jgi:hypothetical protein